MPVDVPETTTVFDEPTVMPANEHVIVMPATEHWELSTASGEVGRLTDTESEAVDESGPAR